MPGGTSSLPKEQNPVDYLHAILEAWNNEPSPYELDCLAEFTKSPETDHDAFCGVLYDLRALSDWDYLRNALLVIDHCTINGSDKFKEHARGNVFRLISLVWRIAGGTIGNTRVIREKVQKLVQLMRPDLMNDLQRSTGIIGTQYGAYSASLSQASRFLQPGFTEGDHAKMLYKLQQSYAILHAFTFLVFDPPPMMEMGLYAGTASPQLPSAIIDLLMGIGNCASHIDREPSARARLRKASGHDAQCIVDGLQAVLTAHAENNVPTSRAPVLGLLEDVCGAANILPQDYWLTDIEEAKHIARGAEADIVRGFLRRESNRIAIVLRIYLEPDMDHKREVITQRQLRHPNILQLLGVFAMDNSRIAIVAPWAPGGDAVTFVREHTSPDCFMRLLLGISSAVYYIHGLKPEVIHGNIHGANILVNEHGEPLLGGFGQSRNKHEPTRSLTTTIGIGYWRHQPPELLVGPSDPLTTQQSDVYAFAMTIYELGTRSVPFQGERGALSVMRKIIHGARPHQPRKLGDLDSPTADSLWDLMGRMWKQDAESRPLAGEVQESLVRINAQRMPANMPASTSATHATVPKTSPTAPHEASPVSVMPPEDSKVERVPPESTSAPDMDLKPRIELPEPASPDPHISKDSVSGAASSESNLTSSVSDIPKDPKRGTASLQSASALSVSNVSDDAKSGTSSENPVTLSASHIPEISQSEPTWALPLSEVATHFGPGSETTFTDLAPDKPVISKPELIPPHLFEVCGLKGRSIYSLGGNEAAGIGSKIHTYLRCCSTTPTEYTTVLKLLQDLCSISGEVPACLYLKDVTVDRLDVVGRGGEALIYGGDFDGRRIVAREMLTPWRNYWCSLEGQRTIKLIRREVITHSLLDHPNIISFLGLYTESTDRPPLVVLPFLERGSLSDVIRGGGARGVEFVWIITGIGRGLAYLHSREPSIFHGDLHPDNILIDLSGNALLCDFGLSRICHEYTRTHTMIREGGRVRFLAPELSDGSEEFRTSAKSDIFSLGMTFLNVWTHQRPFAEWNDRKAEAAIRNERRPKRPAARVDLAPEMEDEFWQLIQRMWAHAAGDRPSSGYVQKRLETIFRPVLEQCKATALYKS